MTDQFPSAPADWGDVSFAVQSGYVDGFKRGHREGHRLGFEAGIRAASLRDLEFARLVEEEFHRRSLQGESAKALVSRLLDAARTEEQRQKYNYSFERRNAA